MTFRLLISSTFALASLHGAAPSKIEFNRDVRPILSENCFACHGFDPKHREGDLRLDTFDGATQDRDGSRGIVPGDLSKSDAWQRIISEDKDEIMPPPKSHKPPLTARQREILKIWIEQGAKYERHWSFEPPKRVSLHPPTANPIDYFIEKKLEENSLKAFPTGGRHDADPSCVTRSDRPATDSSGD
jgi:hypothetical protein